MWCVCVSVGVCVCVREKEQDCEREKGQERERERVTSIEAGKGEEPLWKTFLPPSARPTVIACI